MRRICSVDGGGVRLAIAIPQWVELERQIAPKLMRDVFDMACGTSAGAIASACIAAGMPMTELLALWQSDVPKIFHLGVDEAWIPRATVGYAYKSEAIHDMLVKRLGAAAGWCLNDSPIRLLLCGCGVNGHEWYWVQDRALNAKTTGKLSLVECATASASASTYISETYVSPLGGALVGWCVDGGESGRACPVYRVRRSICL